MVRVLRVELKFSILDEYFKRAYHSTNIGPYTGSYRVDNIGGYFRLRLKTSIEFQPEPEEDGMKHTYGKVFGFKDMDQFQRWFSSDMSNLDWSGYILSEYEVPEKDIIYGNHQLAFSISNAKLISMTGCRQACKDHYRRHRSLTAA